MRDLKLEVLLRVYEPSISVLIRTSTRSVPISQLFRQQSEPAIKLDNDMYFAEHQYLGNCLHLPDHDAANSIDRTAKSNPFTLENGLVTTYGEISGFSGDYFGLVNPISLQPTRQDKVQKFKRWFQLLHGEKNGKVKAEALRDELKELNNKANAAISSGKPGDLAIVYKENPLNISKLDTISNTPAVGAGFMELLQANVDHFGVEARDVYNIGHAVALETAAQGNLQKAYAYNAFADHFLEDSFAAGHMRTPRKELYDIGKTNPALLSYVINASSNVNIYKPIHDYWIWLINSTGDARGRRRDRLVVSKPIRRAMEVLW